jgi:hypothetical protein
MKAFARLSIALLVGWFIFKILEHAMREEQGIMIALINLHIRSSDPLYAECKERLKRVARETADGTVYSEQEQAAFLPAYTRTANAFGEEGVRIVETRFAIAVRIAELQYALQHHGEKLEAP